MTTQIADADTLRECRVMLERYYGSRLKGLVLYESMARNQAEAGRAVERRAGIQQAQRCYRIRTSRRVKTGKLDREQGKKLNWLVEEKRRHGAGLHKRAVLHVKESETVSVQRVTAEARVLNLQSLDTAL